MIPSTAQSTSNAAYLWATKQNSGVAENAIEGAHEHGAIHGHWPAASTLPARPRVSERMPNARYPMLSAHRHLIACLSYLRGILARFQRDDGVGDRGSYRSALDVARLRPSTTSEPRPNVSQNALCCYGVSNSPLRAGLTENHRVSFNQGYHLYHSVATYISYHYTASLQTSMLTTQTR